MNASLTLPDSDLFALYTLIEDARRDESGDVVPWALLEGLAQLIRADGVQVSELDWAAERLVAKQYLEEGGERGVLRGAEFEHTEDTRAYFRVSRDFNPCSDPLHPETEVRATRWSDFYTDRQLRDSVA